MPSIGMRLLSAGIIFLGFGATSFGHTNNPKLEYAMKCLAKDVAQAMQPTKAESPTDVTDGEILNAIMRTRSAVFFMSTIKENKGKVEAGKVVKAEFTPGGWDEAVKPSDVDKIVKLIPVFDDFSVKVVQTLKTAESQLDAEFAKKPEARSFVLLAKTAAEIDNLMAEAHKIFRPKAETAETVLETVRNMEE